MLGIAAAVGGYTVMELNQDLLTVSVTEGLTEDAVTARLHEGEQHAKPAAIGVNHCVIHAKTRMQIRTSLAVSPQRVIDTESHRPDCSLLYGAGGLEPPLYMHTTISDGSSGSGALAAMTPEREWQHRVQALFRTTVSTSPPVLPADCTAGPRLAVSASWAARLAGYRA